MVQAGRDLLQGVTLKVDAQVVRHPERLLSEEADRKRWAWLLGQLGDCQAEKMLQTSNT
jgi:hypothetical protein